MHQRKMARLTFGFALALIIGPFFTGVLAESSGSYDVPILIAGCLMLLGGIFNSYTGIFFEKKIGYERFFSNNNHRNRYNFWRGSISVLVEYARYQIVERKSGNSKNKKKKRRGRKNQ